MSDPEKLVTEPKTRLEATLASGAAKASEDVPAAAPTAPSLAPESQPTSSTEVEVIASLAGGAAITGSGAMKAITPPPAVAITAAGAEPAITPPEPEPDLGEPRRADVPPRPPAGAFYYGRRKKRGNEICQILIRNGDVKPEDVRIALKMQEERGGQIGRILVSMGATSERAISRALLQQLQLRGNPEANLSLAARQNPGLAGLQVKCSPFATTLALILSDLIALLVAVGFGVAVNFARAWVPHPEFFYLMASAVILCAAALPSLGLYGAMAASPPDELRLTTGALTLSVLGVAALAIFGDKATRLWTLFSLGVWWLSAVCLFPLMRALTRHMCARKDWWGHPVVVLGAARTGRLMVRTLQAQPSRGLKPVFLLDDDPAKHGTLRASWTNEQVEVRSIAINAQDLLSDSALRVARELLDLPPDAPRSAIVSSGLASKDRPSSSRESLPGPVSSNKERASEQRISRDRISHSGHYHPTPVPPPLTSTLSGSPLSVPIPTPVIEDREERIPPSSRRDSARPARGMFAEVEGVPLVGDLSLAPILAKRLRIAYAIVAMPGVDSEKLLRLTERSGGAFSHLLIIPDLFGFSSIGVPAKDVGGVLGIEVRQQLLLPGPRFAKRVIDVILTLFGGVFILPVLALLALIIKIDSRGPVLYWQTRLGRDGRHFRAAKFRSMHGDGEARLRAVLDNDPKLKEEYEEFHKLQNDPRVTRFGRIVRKYSLDEFPQLWNVIRGEMSLVGPRPYLEREIKDMEQKEGVILRAMPGMTGMWQVSDRNSTGFSERLRMDVHYVRNWSPWLDIWVLAKTVSVVIRGTGV
jgi:lipopolysaccharide/colanic/teichoic acid biosynthesis glycosyltransferase